MSFKENEWIEEVPVSYVMDQFNLRELDKSLSEEIVEKFDEIIEMLITPEQPTENQIQEKMF